MAWTLETGTDSEAVTYCPTCGEPLGSRTTHEGERPYCDDCDLTLYRNPVPMARATVVDGDRLLLIEMGRGPDEGSWALAGGHIEHDEPPQVAAARELAEETGLHVAPEDLQLIGEGFLVFEDGLTMVSFNYAASMAAAEGTVEAADDAADARFWSRDELETSTPLLRASGVDQLRSALDTFGHGEA